MYVTNVSEMDSSAVYKSAWLLIVNSVNSLIMEKVKDMYT